MDDTKSEFLSSHIESLRRYALSLTRNTIEAEDLVQECLKRALVSRRSGRQVKNPRAYLFTILHNVHVDELTRKQRVGGQVPFETLENAVTTPPDQLSRLEWRDLQRALAAVPAEQKQVMLMVAVEGFSYRSASEELGIPIGTVMSRLNRGRNALRHLLSDRREEIRAEAGSVARRRNADAFAEPAPGTKKLGKLKPAPADAALALQYG